LHETHLRLFIVEILIKRFRGNVILVSAPVAAPGKRLEIVNPRADRTVRIADADRR